jgi:hypothetical protein
MILRNLLGRKELEEDRLELFRSGRLPRAFRPQLLAEIRSGNKEAVVSHFPDSLNSVRAMFGEAEDDEDELSGGGQIQPIFIFVRTR